MDNELKVTLEKHWNPNNTRTNKHNDDQLGFHEGPGVRNLDLYPTTMKEVPTTGIKISSMALLIFNCQP